MRVPIVAILAGAMALCTFAPTTPAQEAIRVETNQVLLPVIVIDKKQDRRISSDNTILLGAAREGNVQLERAILESIVIPGLNASDFQVVDDGKEQVIQSLTYRHSGAALFRDNRGYHDEVFGEGGGKWSSADWPLWMVGLPGLSRYLIAYTLPDSAEGTCHQIKVSVDRPNALVFARREYCHLRDTAADPLKGTILAKQMENDLS